MQYCLLLHVSGHLKNKQGSKAMSYKRMTALVMAVSMVVWATGCSEGMKATSAESLIAQGVDSQSAQDFTALEVETQMTEAQLDASFEEAKRTLDSLVKPNGQLNLKLFGVTAAGQVDPQLLEKPVEAIVKKINLALDRVDGVFVTARAKIDKLKASLNPSNPAHKLLLDKIAELEVRLASLQDRVDNLYVTLSGKVDFVTRSIDMFVATLNPILQFVLMGEISKVKMVLLTFKNDLITRAST